ncbi:hypothetical protein H4219_001948 [Mycoemilia scoparia]|uniref:C2H2-type domain-containing protein n=1 Tax=Mycoemilia scoparia TaxID=417184 RepID=A0A9W7ZYQ5_9FUNG|nr:hypothetical protein H4219_001948 [Mycoemilia scoparia]
MASSPETVAMCQMFPRSPLTDENTDATSPEAGQKRQAPGQTATADHQTTHKKPKLERSETAKDEDKNPELDKEPLVIETSLIKTPSSIPSTPVVIKRKFICDVCGGGFNRKSRLEEHYRSHTGERPFVCDYEGCGKRYIRSTHLNEHRKTHYEHLKRAFKCPYPGCTSGFSTRQHLNRHIEIHTTPRPHKCHFEGCSAAFAKRRQLQTHICTHTGEKPHKCEFEGCGKSFSTPSKLKNHMRAHSTIPRYACGYDQCDAKFAQHAQLQEHIKNTHKPTVFPCHICGKKLSKAHLRDNHLETHNPDRPTLECPHEGCRKVYLSEKSLKMHIKTVHDQCKPFECPEPGCNLRFPYKSIMLRHKKLHDPCERELQIQKKLQRIKAKEEAKAQDIKSLTDIDLLTGRDYTNPEFSDRPIPCIVESCPFRFKRYYDRNRHMNAYHIDYRVSSNFDITAITIPTSTS